ncbi:MAG: hypothetical protein KDB22_07655 [Planctomycetales bacterium]|nr:hypothetical protein [Planctomycetales bacterium]
MKRPCTSTILALAVFFAFISSARGALTLQSYNATQHDRFANNPAFIGNGQDWSGVGRSNIAGATTQSYSWVTLISPSFGLSAWHLRPSVGGTASFFGSNDPAVAPVTRNVVATTRIAGSDLALVQLSSAATGVNFYPVLDLPSSADYAGLELRTFGLSNTAIAQTPANFTDPAVVNSHLTNVRMGRNNIDAVVPNFSDPQLNGSGDVIVFDFDATGGLGADEALVESGDSGSSTFVLTSGGPAIVGIHWFRYSAGAFLGDATSGSGDTFVPSFVADLDLAMAATGSSERVTSITAVPEPGSLVLVACSATCLLTWRRRRR